MSHASLGGTERQTIMFVLTNPENAVVWTKPDTDLIIDPENPFNELVTDDFLTVVMFDLQIFQIQRAAISADELKSLFMLHPKPDLTALMKRLGAKEPKPKGSLR